MTLHILVANTQTPIPVDDVTTLSRIEADGTKLQSTYRLNLDTPNLAQAWIDGIAPQICSYEPFTPILRAGGSITDRYTDLDGNVIAEVVVTGGDCGY